MHWESVFSVIDLIRSQNTYNFSFYVSKYHKNIFDLILLQSQKKMTDLQQQ